MLKQGTTLGNWMVHRARRLGMAWPTEVAESAGVAVARVALLGADAGAWRRLGRSGRGYVARALKVSIRDLEALAAGRIGWIDDARVVDFDRLSSLTRLTTSGPAAARPTPHVLRCDVRRGAPILGRILPDDSVAHGDDWTADEGPRAPWRVAGMPDAFALLRELHSGQTGPAAAIFHPIAPGDLRISDIALLTLGAADPVTFVRTINDRTDLTLTWIGPGGIRDSLALDQTLRAALLLADIIET